MKKALIILTLMVFISVLFMACTPTPPVIGVWVEQSEANGEKYTFYQNNTFKQEIYHEGTYQKFENGTYSYDESNSELKLYVNNMVKDLVPATWVLEDVRDEERVETHNFETNSDDTLALRGVDCLIGGNINTLIGAWTGSFVYDWVDTGTDKNLTHTRKWTFTSTSVTYEVDIIQDGTPITDDSDTGDLNNIDTTNKTFIIETTPTPSAIDGTYSYMVIGDAISIVDDGDNHEYYEKQ